MKILVVFALLTSVAHASQNKYEPVLINGQLAQNEDFPSIIEVYGSSRQGQWSCTATIIGPEVVLTAAHCLGKVRDTLTTSDGVKLTCARHPDFAVNADADMALCRADRTFEATPIPVSIDPVEVDERVLLSGYGCTGRHKRGAGKLRVGITDVISVPTAEEPALFFETSGGAALCFGDSGGPAFKMKDGEIYVAGVNSRGDIKSYSILTAVWVDKIKIFMERFERRFNTKIVRM